MRQASRRTPLIDDACPPSFLTGSLAAAWRSVAAHGVKRAHRPEIRPWDSYSPSRACERAKAGRVTMRFTYASTTADFGITGLCANMANVVP